MTQERPQTELVQLTPIAIRQLAQSGTSQALTPPNESYIQLPCAVVRSTGVPVFPIQSDTIGKIAPAFSKAQGKFKSAKRDTENAGYKSATGQVSKYADLASVHEACMGALNSEGLSVVHRTVPIGDDIYLLTTLFHDSGEWFQSAFPLSTLDSVRQSISDAAKAPPVQAAGGGLDATPAGIDGPARKKRAPGVQALGSEITYLRRYCLASLVGVAFDDDDDGNAAQAHVASRPTQARVNPRPPGI